MFATKQTKGRGWHGDPTGHARAGAKSSGNKQAAKNLTQEARSKGGKMSGGNFKNNPERARMAGKKSRKQVKNESQSSSAKDEVQV